jgi:hypothetical protein
VLRLYVQKGIKVAQTYSSPGFLYGPGLSPNRRGYIVDFAKNFSSEIGHDPDMVVIASAFWEVSLFISVVNHI